MKYFTSSNLCTDRNIEMLIEDFTPKIKKSLRNTALQERGDLEQEVKMKIYEKCILFQEMKTPGFFEFLSS